MTAYDKDFARWSAEQAAALRAHNWAAVDINNISEEIEALGRNDARALRSRMRVLLAHLLKWEYQPNQRKTGWKLTAIEQRTRIEDLLDESPSLRARLPEFIANGYSAAREYAAIETGFDINMFPLDCPWQEGQIMAHDFYPGRPERHV
jgi:Domain of unknown function DUF29